MASFRFLLPSILVLLLCHSGKAQDSIALDYPAINENLLINTSWQYTYTTHAQTNTVIHKAENGYAYYLNLNYDYTFNNFLNGKYNGGTWRLNEAQNQLYYPYRRVDWWHIAEFSDQTLVLEYSPHRKASYKYHFVRVSPDETPFQRAANLLPDIDINDMVQSDRPNYRSLRGAPGKRWLAKRAARRERRKERRRERRAAKKEQEEPEEFLQIELVGGGFFGGIDPVYRNNLVIQTDGQVIWEYETKMMGLTKSEHQIPREDVEALVQFIEEKNFYDFKQYYSCESRTCMKRMGESPRPIALRIAVTRGFHRKMIMVTIFEGDGRENTLVNYPPELDAIVEAINKVANVPL